MAINKGKPRGLGRGLSALMADVTHDRNEGSEQTSRSDINIPIEKISPNPDQPRRSFSKDQLEDLASSIREKGVIQPLIVRVDPKNSGRYEIVAGERRWRAAQMAQLHQLPVIIREFDDTEVLEIAIIENIQRADLNPIEEAAGFRQLMDKFGHTQEKLASALGKSRSHIANLLRLLNLPEPVKLFLQEGALSAGHARALIPSDNPIELAEKVVREGLSVRATEKLVKLEGQPSKAAATQTASSGKPDKDADTKALEGDLSANLGMKVSLNHVSGQQKGRLVIDYTTLDELDELCRILSANH